MNNYCTDQNLTVLYPCGAGGKFLISCLFLFDQIAHWNPAVQHKTQSYQSWFRSVWASDITNWTKYEPNQSWNINFYSRRMTRNNHLNVDDYNRLVDSSASEYFFECWNNGLLIIDHFHKRNLIPFQQNFQRIEILIDDQCIDLYKFVVGKKLWAWDDKTKSALSILDHPHYAHNEINKQHRLKFAENCEVTGYNNFDDFFYQYLLKQPYVQPFYNTTIDSNCLSSISFLDLVQLDRFMSVMNRFEQHFNQSLDHDLLQEMHAIWSTCSQLNNSNYLTLT